MGQPKQQVGALPFRVNGREKIEVLLVTSRGSGHWIPPKGWPMPSRTAWEAARIEALEEAGVSGIIGDRPIGRFDYKKKSSWGIHRVRLYPMMVTPDDMLSVVAEGKRRDEGWLEKQPMLASEERLEAHPCNSALIPSSTLAPRRGERHYGT